MSGHQLCVKCALTVTMILPPTSLLAKDGVTMPFAAQRIQFMVPITLTLNDRSYGSAQVRYASHHMLVSGSGDVFKVHDTSVRKLLSIQSGLTI